MRKEFAEKIHDIAQTEKNLLFLSGDLGFMALEKVKETLGDRFLNMGVAEQSMISAAAGMAHEGFKVIAYSIAPFIVYRPLEQIRNDVCFHDKSVFLVGNGGGYGYGIMGASHHCLEDIAALSSLPNMTCYVPAFIEDLYECIDEIFRLGKPAYLRLGLGKNNPFPISPPKSFTSQLLDNKHAKLTICASGPVMLNVIEALKSLTENQESAFENRVDLFNICTYPILSLHPALKSSLLKTQKLLVVEEHVAVGGLAQQLGTQILKNNIALTQFQSLHAQGYPDGTYGSQSYHQTQSELDASSILKHIQQFFK